MTVNPQNWGGGYWWNGQFHPYPEPQHVVPPVEVHHHWHDKPDPDALQDIGESLKRIERALMTQSDDIAADTAAVLKNNAILADVLTAVDALKASGAPIPAQILADLDAAVAGNGSAASALQADVAPPAPPAP